MNGPHTELYWCQASNNPISIVITVCRLGRVRESLEGEKIDWNCYKFDVGHFRFWIRAMGGFLDKLGDRQMTPISCPLREHEPMMFLDLDTKFYNKAGSRILGASANKASAGKN